MAARPLLDDFTKLLNQIGIEIVTQDVELALSFLKDLSRKTLISVSEFAEISRLVNERTQTSKLPGLFLIAILRDNCLLSRNNPDLLIELLEACRRPVLAKKLKEFRDENAIVQGMSSQQLSEKLQSGPCHPLVCLVIYTKWDDFDAGHVTKLRDKFCDALQLPSPSMVVFLHHEYLECHPDYTQVKLQLHVSDETAITILRRDAIQRKAWLFVELSVVQLNIDDESAICLKVGWNSAATPKRPPFARNESILGRKSEPHDNFKLDLILVIEVAFIPNYSNEVYKLLNQCKKAVTRFQSYHDLHIRVRWLYYGYHGPSGTNIEVVANTKNEFSTDLREIGNEIASISWPLGGMEGPSGLADALELVTDYVKKGEFRQEAAKVCLVVNYRWPGQDMAGRHYLCPNNHDLMKLCNQLALYSVPLYVIGLPMPAPKTYPSAGYHADTGSNIGEEDCFLTGLTAIGGGKFIPLHRMSALAEVIEYAVKETVSLESQMGTVNDLVISEINRKYGDINIEGLAVYLRTELQKRGLTVNCLAINNQPFPAISQLAHVISWANSMQEVEEMVQRWETHQQEIHTSHRQESSSYGEQITVDFKKSGSSNSGGDIPTLPIIGFLEGQPVDLGSAFQMVRRQIHRSAYYR